MKTLDDFKVGDLLLLTQRGREFEEKRKAIVLTVNHGNLGFVAYQCYHDDDQSLLPSGAGVFKPGELGTKQFGFAVAVEIIGHISSRKSVEGQ